MFLFFKTIYLRRFYHRLSSSVYCNNSLIMDAFTITYDARIRPLMDKIDQVRSILCDGVDGVTFPTVVVVGDQSSGKSTLLESLSLVELPKGSGIVTRCPLVLRLRKSIERRVYHVCGDQKNVLNEKQLNITHFIEEETKKLAGAGKNVVHDLIELQVEDPNVRDLTVVDLPGIARNPIGDQPRDIHTQTTNLIRSFIRQEGSVILCVFPANVDVATVESFTLAREVDPLGIRTIGVITKSDLAVNDDALCQQLLMEKKEVLQLKLGFVAVRNRTVDEKINLKGARKREKEFFRNHMASSVVGWNCLGIDALINRLADLYADRVKEIFPKMRVEIQNKVVAIREKLLNYPQDLDTPTARLAKYHELADLYVENILKVRLSSSNGLVNSLHMSFIKFEGIIGMYTQELQTSEYRDEVQKAMSACFGEQLPNFLPQHLLKRLINKQINQLCKATQILIKTCFGFTSKMLLNDKDLYDDSDMLFTKLLPAFRNVVSLYLNDQMQAVQDQLDGLARLEKHDPYTLNPSYLVTIDKQKESDEKKSTDEETLNEMVFSIRSYWTVLTQRFLDYAALSVRAGCVFNVCVGIRDRLRRIPADQCDFVDNNLSEDAHTRAQRKKLQQTHERLEKVLIIIGGSKLTGATNEIFLGSEPMENELDVLAKNISSSLMKSKMVGKNL